MRIFKLIGALVVVLAFSAVAVATSASAEEVLWKWLPGSVGETLKGETGPALLAFLDEKKQFDLKCTNGTLLLTYTFKAGEGENPKEVTASSELVKEGSTEGKDATLALFIIHFTGCKTLGLGANSVGDVKEVILVHVEAHNCMIGPGKFGLLLKPLPLHIEVPATKALVLVRGDVPGLLLKGKEGEKVLTYELDVKTVNKEDLVQEFKKCEGGTEEKLEASLDGVKFEPAFEDVEKALVEFDMTKDTAGEEMMEK